MFGYVCKLEEFVLEILSAVDCADCPETLKVRGKQHEAYQKRSKGPQYLSESELAVSKMH